MADKGENSGESKGGAASTGDTSKNSGGSKGKIRAAVGPIDWLMLALALISVALLIFAMFIDPDPETDKWIFIIDASICGVFLIEFLYRWRKNDWDKWFPLKHWYEVLGMIPIAHPALRGLRLIRVVVVLIRLARAADRAFGEQFTYRFVEKLSRPIVLAIKKPITIAVLDEVVKVLETGNYPQNLARSLQDNKAALREIVAEKLRNDPQVGRMKLLPFHNEITTAVIDTVFRITLEVLADPRIDEFFADVVNDNRDQIRRAVQLGLNDDQDNEKLEEELPTPTEHRVLEQQRARETSASTNGQPSGPRIRIKN